MTKNPMFKKFKIFFLFVCTIISFNVFTQNSSLISDCDDFVSGPTAWPHVLIATTIDSGAASQAAQTFTMNVTSLPAGGANVRVYKTVANGNAFFGNPVALTLGSNSITVAAVTFDRAVKFQFSNGDVEFDVLSLNGDNSACVITSPPPSSSLISDCDDFIIGSNASWQHVLVATTLADGAASQAAQTFTMNVTSLPPGGANVRVYKTVANGNAFFGNPVALTLGSNSITVAAVTFDRAVKFQFSSGDVEFDALSLNGDDSDCVCNTNYSTDIVNSCDSYTWTDGNTYISSNNIATDTFVNVTGCDSIINLDLTVNFSSFFTDFVDVCDSYTWIDGNTYTSSNNSATYTLTNAVGCDSIVSLDLTITNVDADVLVVDDSTLMAQSVGTGTMYQWLDCNNNFAPIVSETNAIFTTQNSGYYAVELTLNDCSVISDCFTINSTLNAENLFSQYAIQLFPNPTSNDFYILLEGTKVEDILIFDVHGRVVLQKSDLFNYDKINISSFEPGTYFVKIINLKETKDFKIIKQ